MKRLGVNTLTWLQIVGSFWLVLTVLFEFSFFLLVMGHPMDELLREYDVFRGRLSCWCWLRRSSRRLSPPGSAK